MAQIQEEIIVIKVSKLIKSGDSAESPIIDNDSMTALEQVAQQLLGDNIIVEVEKA